MLELYPRTGWKEN